ncbi:Ldh family oxidoreductase [Mesorhizobium sp. M7A.F.Ca.US.006.01.1.1]|uniref:Ldh family oxidoreductase n=1 Tax=Mesorhizobium sp. M7A.F.Ca.US.006.01.1.1 TaxID=2496707 RepID=UPI0013E2E104|nr:Ldh family oxidoreductase [Mesorhizobium sp. M7A.F.Ca.US.006.01.1.1]
MEIRIEEAHQLGNDVLLKAGLSAGHATIVTDHLVDAMMAGRAFAGLPRVLALCESLREKGPSGPVALVREDAVSALYDGGDTNGYVTSIIGIDKAIELARNSGVGMVGVRNTWYSGRLAYYVERAAQNGLIAFHTVNATARVAPHGGIDPIFGTNPLAFAFPSDGEPVIVDFGTGSVTWGEVLLRRQTEASLEKNWAVDAHGKPTLDPASALAGAILPSCGHRGYGLALVAQIFAILAGGKVIVDEVADSGFFFLVIDPEKLMPVAEFKARVSELTTGILNSRQREGYPPIRIPGQGSAAMRQRARERGTVEIDEKVYADLLAELERG